MAIRPFTPTRENPADLAARTVGRAHLLDQLARRLREAATSSNLPHSLIVGPRGAGKSHILSVALHDLAQEPHADRLAVVRLPEDLFGVVNHATLLRHVSEALETDAGPGADIGALETAIGGAVGDRTLVLVLENLDRFFRVIGVDGQRDLRGWVESAKNILVLATTPLLFEGVQDRDLPWFGSFNIDHLEDLTLEQGTELLAHLRPDDEELRRFITQDQGQSRLEALHKLTGGSARLWTILGDILTVDLLDDLVPAIELLLENLVNYYMERLGGLGPNEQLIVFELGTGAASQTPSDLAVATGIDPKVVAATLGRLADGRWVRGRKEPGTDQRSTWYELRESLLRHHLQYRNGRGEPLSLVVEVLRIWYDRSKQTSMLVQAPAGSMQETYLAVARSLGSGQGVGSGRSMATVEMLLATARTWANGSAEQPGAEEAGVIIEALLLSPRPEPASTERKQSAEVRRVVDAAQMENVAGSDDSAIAELLRAAAGAAEGETAQILSWVAACWIARTDPATGCQHFEDLLADLGGNESPLAFVIRNDAVRALFEAGRSEDGLVAALALVEECERALGVDHPDTLWSRNSVAVGLERVGRLEEALALYEEVLGDRVRVLGVDHPDTLGSRNNLTSLAVRLMKNPPLGFSTELNNDGLLAVLLRARGGDANAYARLSSWLRDIVDQATVG